MVLRPGEVSTTMAKAMPAMSDLNDATGGVALAEPPSSAPTVRFPALQDLMVNVGPRYLPEVLSGAPAEIGTAVGLAVTDRIGVDNGPIAGMVASRDGRRLVVTNYADDSVSVLDTAGHAVMATLTGLGEPFAIAMAEADSNRICLSTASTACDSITVLDLDTDGVVTQPLTGSVHALTISRDGKLAYASRTGADGAAVAVLDTTTGQVEMVELAPGATAESLAISPDGQRLYVAVQRPYGSALMMIDTGARRVVGIVEIDSAIRDIALNRDGSTVYVAGYHPDLGGVIDIVDARAEVITGSVEIGAVGVIHQLSLSHDGDRVYLVAGHGVTVLSTLTHDVVGTVTLDAEPSCLVESVDGGHLYVADHAGAVTVVSIASTAASLVGEAMHPHGLLELESVLI